MINVENLTKFYGDRVAINSLNFAVNKGEILGFLGPNGAGKSTTMKILTGFMPASSGKVTVAGYDVFEDPIEVKKRTGYLPELPPVYRDMVVRDYLAYQAALYKIKGQAASRAIDNALTKCGLGDVRHRLIGNLSKGYKQRVGLAQAILHNPEVLVLDEPTVGLDPKQIIEIRDLIKSFSGEHTLILSTHILPEVQATCSRVLVINKGKIIASDTLEGISARLHQGNTLVALVRQSSADLAKQVTGIGGVVSVQEEKNQNGETQLTIACKPGEDLRQKLVEFLVSKGGLLEFKKESVSLEEIFVKLTTQE